MELNVQVVWLPDGTFQAQCGNRDVTAERPLTVTGGAATSLKLKLSRQDGTALNAVWFTKAYLAIVCEGEVLAAVETGHTVTAKSDGSLEICWPQLPVNGTAIQARISDRRNDEVTATAPLRRDYEGLYNCCRCALEMAGFSSASDEEPQLRFLIPAAIFPRWHRHAVPEETQQSYFYTKTEADTLLAAKQAAITGGTQGQVVGFDEEGNCVPQAAPSGSSSSVGVETLTATSGTVTIEEYGKVYVSSPADSITYNFTTPEDTGKVAEFELDVTVPAQGSITLPAAVTWKFGTPDLSTAGNTVQLKFRYLNSAWEGWTFPEMSEYLKRAGRPGDIQWKSNVGKWILDAWHRSDAQLDGDAYDLYLGGKEGGKSGLFWVNVRSCYLNLELAQPNIKIQGVGCNQKGGFCASDRNTGNVTSPGDLIATTSSGTISLAALEARVAALEQA